MEEGKQECGPEKKRIAEAYKKNLDRVAYTELMRNSVRKSGVWECGMWQDLANVKHPAAVITLLSIRSIIKLLYSDLDGSKQNNQSNPRTIWFSEMERG